MKKTSTHILQQFGVRLKQVREQTHFTQETLAETSGLHRTYIGDLENGRRNPSLNTMHKLACAFDMTLSELFEGVEDDN